MHVLLIDNEDSFTWNLWQLIRGLGARCDVRSTHDMTIEQIREMKPDRLVISPGPGSPVEATLSCDVLRILSPKIPTLGVCLGHQCIAAVFGRPKSVRHAPQVVHGKTSRIRHTGRSIFSGIPSPFRAARYHSLLVKKIPPNVDVLAWTPSPPSPLPKGEGGGQIEDMLVMAMQHRTFPIVGVQFHPESFMTEHGERLMNNFLFEFFVGGTRRPSCGVKGVFPRAH